ncbi:molybdopterin-dependent oxidoreductase [Brassicibacter mesophilus]|uniref:molybdopterin-dependent oxidoreductase n=1 Tax=Brassicibacter mesophilus TaxID=745119 RepID=UPI003D1CE6F8
MKKLVILIMSLILALSIAACAKSNEPIDVVGDVEIIAISGLQDEVIVLNIEEIKSVEPVTKDVISISSSGEEKKYKATGALFETILQKYNKSQKDLAGIRLVAGDGYSIDVPSEVLKSRDVILAYEIDGKPLDEKSKPIRIVVPDERAMYWVRNLSEIEIIKNIEKDETQKLIVFDTATQILNQYDYTYYESVDKAVKSAEIMEQFVNSKNFDRIYIKSSDGLEKNETTEVFKTGYIKVTGEEAPLFLSPDMPKGMHVKHILWFGCDNTGFLSVDEALKTLESKTYGDKIGVALKDIFDEVGMAAFDKYVFKSDDGYSVEISSSDIDKGVVYKKDNVVRVYFEGLDKSTSVKKLLSIEAVK